MSYMRVVPRDLFNESKLLKCLGQLSVAILDEKLVKYGVEDFLEEEDSGFLIDHTEDGDTYCLNYHATVLMVNSGDRYELQLFSRLNSKDAYPLICVTDDNEYLEVFTDQGKFTKEFLKFLSHIYNY